MKKNYAAKVAANRQMYLDIGQDVGVQMMADFLTVTLNDADIMGRDTFGAKRILKVLKNNMELFSVYAKAYGTGPEADYYRAKLDERLKQILGEENFSPFEERYPFITKIKY